VKVNFGDNFTFFALPELWAYCVVFGTFRIITDKIVYVKIHLCLQFIRKYFLIETTVMLIAEGLQKIQSLLDPNARISRENTHGVIPTREKYKDSTLNKRHTGFPKGCVFNAAQKKKIRELEQQIITKICSFADGISLILDANGFETTKNILDVFSNIARYICNVLGESEQSQKLKQLFKAYICNVGTEKTDVVLKRLVASISSTCKIVLKLAPHLIRLQTLLKLFPHVSLLLDITEVLLNYKNFTKDGLTAKNVMPNRK
jgi:hypothetical protein